MVIAPGKPRVEETPMARLTRVLAVIVFLSALVGTAAVDLFNPLPAPALIGKERANFDRLDQEARWLDGTKARRIAIHRRLSSRVRGTLGPVHAASLLRYFHESASEQVLVGGDGWLFLDRQVAGPAKGQRRPSIDRSAALLAAAARRITAKGTRFVAVPVPRKSTVMADLAPSGIELFPSIEGELLERLGDHGVETIDLRPMFDGLAPHDRYLKFDSHWAQAARVGAAGVMVDHAGVRSSAPSTRLVEAPWLSYSTDLLRFAGIPDDSWARSWLLSHSEKTFEVRARAPERDPERAHEGKRAPRPIQAVKDRMPPLALFGTSFSSRLGDYLAHFADSPVFDGSQPGGFFLDSLARLRQCYNFGAWPEVLWYEFPVFKALRQGQDRNWTLSTSQGFSLSVLPIVPTSPLRAEMAPTTGTGRLAIDRGHLITSGNGIAMVRVTREGSGPGEGLWSLRTANLTAEVPWHAARKELLIPIIATHDLGGEVQLIAKANGAPTMDVTATLVTDLDLESRSPGTPERVRTDGQTTQTVTFTGVTIERHSAIVAHLDLGSWQGPLELRSRTATGSTAIWRAEGAGQVTIVLDLSRHAGETLSSFEVSLPAGAPPWRIDSADWAPRLR